MNFFVRNGLAVDRQGERIKIKNQEKPQILRIDAEKNLRRTRRKGEFVRIFYDYSCTFASIRGQFENAEEECPQ
ncbi:MAG: hypothetical protein LBT01_07580, partial [Spirochaetaceae bacterium]|nr:hypothetical protein [Spirochaetaceae bacterium]